MQLTLYLTDTYCISREEGEGEAELYVDLLQVINSMIMMPALMILKCSLLRTYPAQPLPRSPSPHPRTIRSFFLVSFERVSGALTR